MLNTNGQFKDT